MSVAAEWRDLGRGKKKSLHQKKLILYSGRDKVSIERCVAHLIINVPTVKLLVISYKYWGRGVEEKKKKIPPVHFSSNYHCFVFSTQLIVGHLRKKINVRKLDKLHILLQIGDYMEN